MRAVDTNVLIRLLTRDDATQAAAADDFVKPGAWVSHVVLIESMWVLDSVYGLGHEQIAVALEMLLDHQELVLQDADIVTAALDRYRKRPKLGFSDCMVLEIARKAGHLPLGTFDRPLGKCEGAELVEGG
jgi:predicted nucleic-acid-binding protein